MTRRTRRKLTIENSHCMHKNPYSGAQHIYLAMEWAHVHHATCERCRRRFKRMSTPKYERKAIAKRLAEMVAGDE